MAPVRLYTKGKILSYKRGLTVLHPNASLIKIEGVNDRKAADFYLGKRVAYIYHGKKSVKGSTVRVIWGTISRPHGNSGVVRARFQKNIPARAFGATVRVMMFPSRV